MNFSFACRPVVAGGSRPLRETLGSAYRAEVSCVHANVVRPRSDPLSKVARVTANDVAGFGNPNEGLGIVVARADVVTDGQDGLFADVKYAAADTVKPPLYEMTGTDDDTVNAELH